jgi:microcin C transport system substrate-binding protein
MMSFSRKLLFGTIVAVTLGFAVGPSFAGAKPTHGLSAFGDLKYSADFAQFDYVNPAAPKGGALSMIGATTYSSLNGFILKGDPAQGLGYLFDSLMVPAQDEPDAVYALVAKTADVADDGLSVTFELRQNARFADGTPLTAQDVVFSFDILKEKGHPNLALQLRDVIKAQAVNEYRVTYTFKGTQLRDLAIIVAKLPIFSKAYYATREFDETTLEPPLGSGPYKVKSLKVGRTIAYQRREDYWARDLPANKGRYNFDELVYEYFRDRTAEFEAFKAGVYDLREEFTSRVWATQYNFEAIKQGRVIKTVLPNDEPSGAQGFFLNMRRDKFSDKRVRKALDYAFDFKWTNKKLFYGAYKRTNSFFENSVMKATGVPQGAELALLEPFRSQLPPEVFSTPYMSPVSNGSGQDRKLLRTAIKLLKQAGWTIKDGVRTNQKGEKFTIEFLTFSPSFERIIAPIIKNLKLLGIRASIRRVDPAQYQERLKSFDFDITTRRYTLRITPGVELRSYWGSAYADIKGSLNLSGIKDPVVDALIEKVTTAKSREQLNVAARALDRVLRAGNYWIPQWYKASHTLAYWNRFSYPTIKPKYARGIIETWWYDAAKAAKLAPQ